MARKKKPENHHFTFIAHGSSSFNLNSSLVLFHFRFAWNRLYHANLKVYVFIQVEKESKRKRDRIQVDPKSMICTAGWFNGNISLKADFMSN